MAKKDLAYDHPAYLARVGQAMGEAGGAATTAYAKFAAFTALQAFSAQMTVTTAGTAAGHGFVLNKISGTSTVALGTQTIGTSTAGSTFNLLATNVAGGVALLPGDILQVNSLADATGKVAVSYEVAAQPLAQVTA